jgi:hypothetical protein
MTYVARSRWFGFALGILCTLALVAALGSVAGVWADALAQDPLSPDQESAGPTCRDGVVSRSTPLQGRLTDAGGNPINGAKSITFTLYTGAGTVVCQDNHSVTVVNGLFDAFMDSCTAANINGQQLYLGIRLAGEAAEMTPRQPIRPVPYAFSLVPGAEIGGTGAGDGSLYLKDDTGVTVIGLTAAGALVDVGGLGNAGDIYVRNITDTATFAVNGNTGDVRQSLAADGLVKAAVYATCSDTVSSIERSFNNVAGTITIDNGAASGRCTIDFWFDVSDRYVVATPAYAAVARSVTYHPGSTASRIDFYRWDSTGVGASGNIMVLVY